VPGTAACSSRDIQLKGEDGGLTGNEETTRNSGVVSLLYVKKRHSGSLQEKGRRSERARLPLRKGAGSHGVLPKKKNWVTRLRVFAELTSKEL